MHSQPRLHKIIIAGDSNSGKSTFILKERFLSTEDKSYGVPVHVVPFHTTSGDIYLGLWDVSNAPGDVSLEEGYYPGAEGAIIMFDKTSKESFDSVPRWIRDIRSISPNVNIVLVGSRSNTAVSYDDIYSLIGNSNMVYYDASERKKIFTSLMSRITSNPQLEISSDATQEDIDLLRRVFSKRDELH